jgi:hypothetical protein
VVWKPRPHKPTHTTHSLSPPSGFTLSFSIVGCTSARAAQTHQTHPTRVRPLHTHTHKHTHTRVRTMPTTIPGPPRNMQKRDHAAYEILTSEKSYLDSLQSTRVCVSVCVCVCDSTHSTSVYWSWRVCIFMQSTINFTSTLLHTLIHTHTHPAVYITAYATPLKQRTDIIGARYVSV